MSQQGHQSLYHFPVIVILPEKWGLGIIKPDKWGLIIIKSSRSTRPEIKTFSRCVYLENSRTTFPMKKSREKWANSCYFSFCKIPVGLQWGYGIREMGDNTSNLTSTENSFFNYTITKKQYINSHAQKIAL